MSNQRVLITGAAGFLGNACAREFLSRGFAVVALTHSRPAEGLAGAEQIPVSMENRESLLAAIAPRGPFVAAVHCAGRASDVGRAKHFRAANLQAVLNLIDCMDAAPIGRLVHISTTDVYGLRDFNDADESTLLSKKARNPYPRFKILAEQAVIAKLPPQRWTILRPGAVWGPGDRTILPRVLEFLRSSPRIIYFGKWRGQNRWPLAHVRNLALAAFLAATRDEAGGEAYNVVDPQKTTMEQYFRQVLNIFLKEKAGMKSLCLPMWIGQTIGLFATAMSNLLDRSEPLFDPTLYGLQSATRNLDFSSRKLENLFTRAKETFLSREDGFKELKLENEKSG